MKSEKGIKTTKIFFVKMNQITSSVRTALGAVAAGIQQFSGRVLDHLEERYEEYEHHGTTGNAFHVGLPGVSHSKAIENYKGLEVYLTGREGQKSYVYYSRPHRRRSRNSSEEDEDTKLRDMVSTSN